MAKQLASKYAPQETYAAKMAKKGCVRITVWVHETKAARFKKNARKNCVV
jgi:hypothetical protein